MPLVGEELGILDECVEELVMHEEEEQGQNGEAGADEMKEGEQVELIVVGLLPIVRQWR